MAAIDEDGDEAKSCDHGGHGEQHLEHQKHNATIRSALAGHRSPESCKIRYRYVEIFDDGSI
jgi:hypothetical protein